VINKSSKKKISRYMASDIEMIKSVYDNMASRVDAARKVGHPMTLRENFIQSLMGWSSEKLLAEELIMLTLLR
jgi:hypothetical protein